MHPQSCPVNQFGHQPGGARHGRQHRLHFFPGQDHRNPLPLLHPLQIAHPAQGLPENLLVEEDEGVEGLGLGGCGHPTFDRQVVQISFYLGRPHFLGMALAVKEDELPAPVAIRRFGVAAEMPGAADVGKLVQQAGRGGTGITPLRSLLGERAPA